MNVKQTHLEKMCLTELMPAQLDKAFKEEL